MIELKSLPIENCNNINSRITSVYGYRVLMNMYFHNGVDISPKVSGVAGDKILAVDRGKVIVAKTDGAGINKGYGNYIILEHDGYCTLYAHLSGFNCKANDIVKAGQVIGFMGTTGDSTGVHLHFEIRMGAYGTDFWKKYYDKAIHTINPLGYLENVTMNLEQAKMIIMSDCNISKMTIDYLDFYKYSNDLILKLAKGINIKGNE